MERNIIGIMKSPGPIERRTGSVENSIPINDNGHILKCHIPGGILRGVNQVLDYGPIYQIRGNGQREKISCPRSGIVHNLVYPRNIIPAFFVKSYVKLAHSTIEFHKAIKDKLFLWIVLIQLHHEGFAIGDNAVIHMPIKNIGDLIADKVIDFSIRAHHRISFVAAPPAVGKGPRPVSIVGKEFTAGSVSGIHQIAVFRNGYNGRFMAASFPRAIVHRRPDPSLVMDHWVGRLRHSFLFALPRAREQCDRFVPGFPVVIGITDLQFSILRRCGQKIDPVLVKEQLAPETGEQIAQVLPSLSVVIRLVKEGKILRGTGTINIHRNQQTPCLCPHNARAAQIAAGKTEGEIMGMEIIHHRADDFSRAKKR